MGVACDGGMRGGKRGTATILGSDSDRHRRVLRVISTCRRFYGVHEYVPVSSRSAYPQLLLAIST